jgi:hypothetical protein
MRYVVLAWLANWEYLEEEGDMNYEDSKYIDAYFLVYSNCHPKLFDDISEAETSTKKECKYFKIIDFYSYRIENMKYDSFQK